MNVIVPRRRIALGNLASDTCDNMDTDCDAAVDENAELVWFTDADGDGYGDSAASQAACTPPNGFVADNTDSRWLLLQSELQCFNLPYEDLRSRFGL